jgi:Domain of unknown function (DUF202)
VTGPQPEGAHFERTALAWNRTGLAATGLTVVVFRMHLADSTALALAVLAICAPVAMMMLVGGTHRTRLPFATAMLIAVVAVVELLGIVS